MTRIAITKHGGTRNENLCNCRGPLRIVEMKGEPQYAGKIGKVDIIDDIGQFHGSWIAPLAGA